MIKEAGLEMLDEVSDFVFGLNQIKQYQCRPFKVDYVLSVIKEIFRELIEHEEDKLLVNIIDDELVGVLGLFTEVNEKYLQGMPGIYAKNDFQKIGNEFIRYLELEYKSFNMMFAYPKENVNGIKLMDNNEFKLLEIASIYELNVFVERLNKKIPILNNDDIKEAEIKRFYNEYQGDIYWTLNKIMADETSWVLKHFVEDGLIRASIFIRIYDDVSAEVFGIIREKEFSNHEVIRELLVEASIECQDMGINTITLFSEFDSDSSIAEDIGFKLVDTHLTYIRLL